VLADGWLVKPVDPGRLIETVREVIRRRPTHNRVLVVEDDDDLRTVVATVLENGGLSVTQARSVSEARAALASGAEPDLVLLDLQLPGGNGQELVADLRRHGRLREVPLVVYSGAEVSSEEREDLRLGQTVFLTKSHAAPDAVLRSVLDLLDVVAGRAVASRTGTGDGDETGERPSPRTS